MEKDYYKILGVPKEASAGQIKQAYRTLAMKYHPDRNVEKSAEEKTKNENLFKEINEAYAVLGDPEKRQQYDAYGPDAFSQHFTQEDIFRNFNIEDVLRQMGFDFGMGSTGTIFDVFGFGTQGARGPDVGSDILAEASITLKEAAKGVDKQVMVNHIKECDACSGSGAEKGSKILKCDKCNGTGQQKITRRTPFGMMQTVSTCAKCRGSGKSFEKECKRCNGYGVVRGQSKVEVKIPRGVATGMRLRVKGMGDRGRDGAGDLYLQIHVQSDKTFKRGDDDLHVSAHVPFYTAALGGTIKVPTLDGKDQELDIPAGTQTGTIFAFKEKGMPRFNANGFGNETIHVIVDTPDKLSSEQKELLEKFRDTEGGKSSSKKKKWF